MQGRSCRLIICFDSSEKTHCVASLDSNQTAMFVMKNQSWEFLILEYNVLCWFEKELQPLLLYSPMDGPMDGPMDHMAKH